MRRAVLLALAVVLGIAAAPDGRAGVSLAPRIDEEVDCLEPVPQQVGLGATPLDAKRGIADVLVLLDDGSLAQGVAAVKDATRAYGPVGVDLRARFPAVRVPADGTTEGSDGGRFATASTDRTTAVAERAVGGSVPRGTEVVYLLTGKELYLGEDQTNEDDRSYGVAGIGRLHRRRRARPPGVRRRRAPDARAHAGAGDRRRPGGQDPSARGRPPPRRPPPRRQLRRAPRRRAPPTCARSCSTT